MKKLKPAAVVGVLADHTEEEIAHDRTLGPHRERYGVRGASILASISVNSEAEIDQFAAKTKVKMVKKRQKPGKERYQRLENEPIRI